jgi:hypothetical protein
LSSQKGKRSRGKSISSHADSAIVDETQIFGVRRDHGRLQGAENDVARLKQISPVILWELNPESTLRQLNFCLGRQPERPGNRLVQIAQLN